MGGWCQGSSGERRQSTVVGGYEKSGGRGMVGNMFDTFAGTSEA